MQRTWCHRCRRPGVVCLCPHITPLATRTRFVLLTHPKEVRKVKNGTGRTVHLSLPNSEIVVGVNFDESARIAGLLADPGLDCRLVYPGPEAMDLSRETFRPDPRRRLVLFLIDATWPCAKKIMRLSRNLHDLPRVTFDPSAVSEFSIKQQPHPMCLSTLEATDRILRSFHEARYERYDVEDAGRFLAPFRAMIRMQRSYAFDPETRGYRRSSGYSDPTSRKLSSKHTPRSIVFQG